LWSIEEVKAKGGDSNRQPDEGTRKTLQYHPTMALINYYQLETIWNDDEVNSMGNLSWKHQGHLYKVERQYWIRKKPETPTCSYPVGRALYCSSMSVECEVI